MLVQAFTQATETVLKLRHAREIRDNRFSVGGETLDRAYTDFDQWSPYLGPLGCKRVRLQSGWARCEPTAGQYDFDWLERIVDAVIAQGVRPWMNLCYHNPCYGGGLELGSRLPSTPEAMAGWLRYVETLVTHLSGRAGEWEIWNEPNNDPAFNTPARYADFVVQTASLIRRLDPKAIIHAGVLAHVPLDYAQAMLQGLSASDGLRLIDCITYHPYDPNPDDSRRRAADLAKIVRQFDPRLRIMQGETGAPSERRRTKALANHDWTELTQAKYALRQLLGDIASGIDSSIFSISDMCYPDEINRKGLLLTDEHRKVLRPKLAYRAVQNITAMFDVETVFRQTARDESTGVVAHHFDHPEFGAGVVLWRDTAIPSDDDSTAAINTYACEIGGNFSWRIDLLTGIRQHQPANCVEVGDWPIVLLRQP